MLNSSGMNQVTIAQAGAILTSAAAEVKPQAVPVQQSQATTVLATSVQMATALAATSGQMATAATMPAPQQAEAAAVTTQLTPLVTTQGIPGIVS